MSFHQASLDGVIRLSDIKDKSDLITSKLKEIVVNICKSVIFFESKIIQVGGFILEGTVGDYTD